MRSSGTAARREATPPADPDSAAAAEEVALRILAAAAQSAAGLQSRLERRGFAPEAAAGAVGSMVALGYVDDAALARSIAGRRQRTGHGRIQVGAELRARGIESDTLANALTEIDVDAERAAALALGRSLLARGNRDLDDRRDRQRLGGALQRRGFDSDTVGWVLRELERGS